MGGVVVRGEAELGEDPLDVLLHRRERDHQRRGDRGVRPALGHQRQHLLLDSHCRAHRLALLAFQHHVVAVDGLDDLLGPIGQGLARPVGFRDHAAVLARQVFIQLLLQAALPHPVDGGEPQQLGEQAAVGIIAFGVDGRIDPGSQLAAIDLVDHIPFHLPLQDDLSIVFTSTIGLHDLL